MKYRLLAALGAVALSAETSAQAGLFTTPVQNNSFEDSTISAATAVTSWAEENNTNNSSSEFVDPETASGYPNTPAGSWWAGFNVQDAAAIYQQIGTWEPNTTYTISLLVAQRTNQTSYGGLVVGLYHGGTALTPGTTTDTADGTTLASRGALLSSSTTVSPPTAQGIVESRTFSLTTGTVGIAGEPLWLRLSRSPGTAGQTTFDNVSVTPEPASIAAFGIAALGLLARRSRTQVR